MPVEMLRFALTRALPGEKDNVYGCWVIQYGGQWTEFMMLPRPDRPGLKTPKTLHAMLLHGARNGAEGADAYCIYDPAYDRNYACLAEYSCRQRGSARFVWSAQGF